MGPRRRVLATATALACLTAVVAPRPAPAADAPVWVPSRTTGDVLLAPDLRARFPLPEAYAPARLRRGTTRDGSYSCRVAAASELSRSVVALTAVAGAGNRPVRVRRGRVDRRYGAFRVTDRGRVGALRWYTGRRGGTSMAVAYERAPEDPRLNGRRYVAYDLRLTVLARIPQGSPCRRAARATTVRRAIRSMRLVDAWGERLRTRRTGG